MTLLGLVANANGPGTVSSTPKMAGVFEVEVDGVDHDHGLEHHDEPHQVRVKGHGEESWQIKQTGVNLYWESSCQLGALCKLTLNTNGCCPI